MFLNFGAPMGGKFARRRTDKEYFSGHYKQATCFFGSSASTSGLSNRVKLDDTTLQGIAPQS
jgi:hypothetical protein